MTDLQSPGKTRLHRLSIGLVPSCLHVSKVNNAKLQSRDVNVYGWTSASLWLAVIDIDVQETVFAFLRLLKLRLKTKVVLNVFYYFNVFYFPVGKTF